MGEEYESPARSITEADIVNFSAISGDGSPVHADEEYCKRTPYTTRIAHSLLALAAVEGPKQRIAAFADIRYMASLRWNYELTGPILIRDTICVRVKIASKRETKESDRGIVVEYVTMLNQRGEIVPKGEHGLMALRKGSL